MDVNQTNNQQGDWNSSEKSGMLNPQAPPPYAGNPVYPGSYPCQPVPAGGYAQAPYPGQSVVAVQPTVYVAAAVPLTNPVPDYLGYSIFTLLCCCFPLGIAALIYSCATRDANFAGQRELAEKNSKTARVLNHVGLGIGLSVIVLVIIIQVVVIFNVS